MRYSIITPSIVRSTLNLLCKSIDCQTNQDYEHLIIVDIPKNQLTEEQYIRLSELSPKQRIVLFCGMRHQNCGNTCRYNGTKLARGNYIYYVDDDDFIADDHVLETLNQVTEEWAIFPVNACGRMIYSDPPGMCRTTTGGFLLRRGLIDWPDVPNYETDGMVVEELLRRGVPYQRITDRCMTVHPKWNVGRML